MNGVDISAKEEVARLGGKEVILRFDHNQMRMAEEYWQHTTRRKLGYLAIIDQLAARTYSALGAIAYGAAASAAMARDVVPVSMRDFDKQVSYTELKACANMLSRCVIDSFPRGTEGSSGNAQSRT